jgi:acetyl esterase/lipase
MLIQDYPPQEPLSPAGQAYHEELMRRLPLQAGVELSYGEDPYQSLSIFPASQPTGDVLVFFHGGGWTSGYKEWMSFMAPPLGAEGITFVSAGYRLAPQHLFPTGFLDCCAAVRSVVTDIASYGGNPDRIFVGGHSAGGHYSALMAVRRDWQTEHGLPANVIKGCLPISGVYTFGEGSGLSVRPRFLGSADAPAANVLTEKASPLNMIQGTPPPFLLAFGTKDFPHLIPQAGMMARALKAAGGKVVELPMDGRDHFTASFAGGEADGPWVHPATRWMESQ